MATIHIDGKEYEVDGTENLLEACLSLGLNVPYFCWHPALGSVGSCRQCAVKQYQNPDDKRGRLVMSCMTPAQDGVYISIEDEEVVKFRKALIEFTMTNHPHDCPVCEEGGNCHLQDMTVMSGQNNRRYRFNKRTHNNQDLGPFINHEMNRCIACYRCVRYYRDYAEGTDFGVYGSHDNVYFGRINSGTLDNEFSGNLVEVCPTGVFTDKTHSERFNRKWDMQFSPSICQQCSVGCNTSPGERYGELRRIENRFNGSVNHYFLCDRGRFGYGYVNLKDRPRQPQLKQADTWHIINKQEAIEAAKSILEFAKGVVAIGSPRASLESNFALRELVGAENFYSGIDANEQALLGQIQMILRESGIHTPTLREIERYDAVVVLGEDVTQTAARVSLAIRQALKGKSRELAAAQRVPEWSIAAVQNIGQGAKHPLFITSLDSTRLDDVAASVYHGSIADQARYGFALAHAIDNNAPEVTGFTSELNEKIQHVADVLKTAKHPLIVSGTALKDKSIIQAAANIAKALKASGCEQVGLTFITGEANSMGLALMNAKPIEKAFEQFANDNADTLVVMENDLYRRASEEIVNRALAKAENIIVIDHQHTDIMARADLIISAASFAEGDGTLVNHEGRVQRFFQVFDPSFYDKRHLDASGRALPEDTTDLAGKSIILESWRWLSAVKSVMANKNGADWTTLDHVMGEFAQVFPDLGAILTTAPDAQFRIRGMRVARQPSRYSGRTSMNANVSIHEQRQPVDNDSAFVFSMEGYMGTDVPRQQIPFAWSPGWNSPQAWNKFQDEVGGSLRAGDPGVRLFEKAAEASLTYFQPIVASNKTDSLTVVPYYHLFGSEELSQRSEVIQQRMPEAYVILNQQDAQKMSLTEGGYVKLSCQAQHFELKVKISKNLASGLVGLPIGLPKLSPSLIGAQVETLQEVSQ